jgi:hypothetical protein
LAEAESKEEILRLLQEQSTSASKQVQTLDAVDEKLTAAKNSVWEVLTSVKRILAIVWEMKDTLAQLARFVVSSRTYLRFIDSTRELPVTIEDALGKIHTIPPEWIEKLRWTVSISAQHHQGAFPTLLISVSIQTFYSLLEDQFIGSRGYEMVCKRQYVLEENCTGKEINSRVPLSHSFRRGMKVNMSMVFMLDTRTRILPGVCPRCNAKNQAPEGMAINW